MTPNDPAPDARLRAMTHLLTYALAACWLSVSAPALVSADEPAAPAAPPTNFNVAEARKSVVFIRTMIPGVQPRVGSGFLVSDDGLVYTNRHVVRAEDAGDDPAAAAPGTVVLVGVPSAKDPDELDYFKAEVVFVAAREDELDFAVLKIAAKEDYGKFKPLATSAAKLELGESVAAIGYPHVLDDQPTLSFTKGSVTATRSRLQGKAYCQTDAAVNPGNSGGPLLDTKGEAVGIVTYKKLDAENVGFALYLKEAEAAIEAANKRLAEAKVSPEPGPLDPAALLGAAPAGIKPLAKNWDVGAGETTEGDGFLSVDNNGGEYWLVSKQELPEDFQLVIPCRVEFLKGRQVIYESQRSILRMLCVRFGTDDVKSEIMERKGNLLQFSHEMMLLWKEGEAVERADVGNVEEPFTLTITRRDGDITVSADGHKLLSYHDDKPLAGRHKFCVGGYLSRLAVGEVQVIDLSGGGGKGEKAGE